MTGIDGRCAEHADRAASFLCARCGDYACEDCAHRVVPSAEPVCAGCWRLRERVELDLRQRQSRHRHVLVIGAAALLLLVWLGAVVLTLLLG